MIRVIYSERKLYIPQGELIFQYNNTGGTPNISILSDGGTKTLADWLQFINSAVTAITNYDLFSEEFAYFVVNNSSYPGFKARFMYDKLSKMFGVTVSEILTQVNGKLYAKKYGSCRLLFEDDYRLGNEATQEEPFEYEGAYTADGRVYQASFETKCIVFNCKVTNLTDLQAMEALRFFNFLGSNTPCRFKDKSTAPDRFTSIGLSYNNFQIMKNKSFLDKGKMFNISDISFKMVWRI